MNKIVITGGAGFIGSHIVERFTRDWPQARIIILDKMTYAADFRNVSYLLQDHSVELVVGDICDFELCTRLLRDCDLLIHAAAESHVDKSFRSALSFTQTNVVGTHTILEAARAANVRRIVHISTDEVYGEILSGAATEETDLNPTNPYSASKAAAEMIIRGYTYSFDMPIVMVRANNVFGARQFPEKLIPRCCMSLIGGKKIPLHGDGRNSRHYLSAYDLAAAVELIARVGVKHEVYNVGSEDEFQNREIAQMICDLFDVPFAENVEFISDRPFNDRRYAVDWKKITALGWKPQYFLRTELPHLVNWYRLNFKRFQLFEQLEALDLEQAQAQAPAPKETNEARGQTTPRAKKSAGEKAAGAEVEPSRLVAE
jgi:dTDP-glucose 4,6-dehydratase